MVPPAFPAVPRGDRVRRTAAVRSCRGRPGRASVPSTDVGDLEAGDGTGPDDDAFRRLLEPGFQTGGAIREPSAAERERAARSADLRRRLAEEQAHERRLQDRDRRRDRKVHRRGRLTKVAGPLIVVGLVAGIVLVMERGGGLTGGSAEVQARPKGFPPVTEEASKPLGTPPPLPAATGPFEFEQTHDDGRPVAWDPCRPVPSVVNPAGQPPGGDVLVEQAIANTAAATGLRFESAGPTDEPWRKDRDAYQPDRYGDRWAPVLISWATSAEVPQLGGYVAGLGGPWTAGLGDGEPAYVSGGLVLDAGDLTPALAFPGGADQVRSVIQHELGHVVGLDHVDDPRELMNTEGSPLQTSDWGPGDRRGLAALGRGECHPEL